MASLRFTDVQARSTEFVDFRVSILSNLPIQPVPIIVSL
jgi:hypothetical protein